MNVIIKDADVFRRIINCLKDLITDSGELIFESRGIFMKSTDTSKVVMIDIHLEENAFSKYELEKESEELKLPLNFINFNDILKLSKSAQIGLVYKPETEKITIKMSETTKKKIQFNMVLSSVDKEELEIGEIIYETKVYIDAIELQKSIKDLSSFGKKCVITVNENEIMLSVTGDAGTGEICISDIEIETNTNENFTGIFSMKYLNFFAKAGLSNEIVLKFGKNVPFCFEYQLENGYVKFYLAQLISD